MAKYCKNCAMSYKALLSLKCEITKSKVGFEDYCDDWNPNNEAELVMLREENEKLKNENLALPHLLEYNKELEEKMQWISVKDRLPENRKPVLAVVKEDAFIYVVRASYAKKFDIESTTDYDEEFFDYDEKTDAYYCKPGWYENNVFEDIHWGVCGEVTHWMLIPESPPKDGDNNE